MILLKELFGLVDFGLGLGGVGRRDLAELVGLGVGGEIGLERESFSFISLEILPTSE